MVIRFRLLLLTLLLGLLGCQPSTSLEPPAGWQAADGRWWRDGVDTTLAFRDLTSLAAMGLEGTPMASVSRTYAAGEVLVQAVRRSLTPLFRVHPEIIDSLFNRHITPDLEQTSISGDLEAEVDRLRQESYRELQRYFREPRPVTRLGEDVPIVYPDSLIARGVAGKVEMQVYLDAEGQPQAIKLLEGVHPVLDRLAMRATAQMRWQPAYVRQGNTWQAVPSWVRFNIRYQIPER
ncbi:TonB family protein [Rhodothermus profundi]|uniref:TonB family C-terminal domain-containing protein n=1 Tax=Rhodothermus profundi TaxID=633813 RepID=A0A1M6UUC9_9BACT|nr:TonB family protein [Rhodothermus profundi]SHK72774.1 TonB family C-terminal domain-containing protein [Rhodothermus profundi]